MKTPEPLMRTVVVESLGGPEVLNVREARRPSPAAGEALIEVHRMLTVPIPDGVEDAAALAVLVQGLTAWHALVSAARVQAGETVAVTAAAGGVGSLAIQIARLHGAGRVIAVTSTEQKRRLTMALGADAPIASTPEDSQTGCARPTMAAPSTWCWNPSAAPSSMPR